MYLFCVMRIELTDFLGIVELLHLVLRMNEGLLILWKLFCTLFSQCLGEFNAALMLESPVSEGLVLYVSIPLECF